jgi:uncharacterized lipoprotein YmbA
MKKWGMMLLLAVAGSAHAYSEGSAEELTKRVRVCKVYADLGDLYYRMALQGKKPTAQKDDWAEPMRQHIEDEIFGNVASYDRQSAAEMAGTYCLDNIVRLSHGA